MAKACKRVTTWRLRDSPRGDRVAARGIGKLDASTGDITDEVPQIRHDCGAVVAPVAADRRAAANYAARHDGALCAEAW